MRHISWADVLRDNRIPFIERGANVSRGELNIRCPFCGSADPSYHMGLSLETGFWACWRNSAHRGKSPVRLLVRLLDVSVRVARELAGLGEDWVDPEGFSEAVARFMGRLTFAEDSGPVWPEMPSTMRAIVNRGATRHQYHYLERRGFTEVDALVDAYGLLADCGGPWSYRVVIPYVVERRVAAWTGRAIADAEVRYKDLSVDQSAFPIKHMLYNADALDDQHAHTLVVVEGPIDALKLDFYSRDFGVRAVGLSTNTISEPQADALLDKGGRFRRVLFMMDNATRLSVVDSMRMRAKLALLRNTGTVAVPAGKKDAGDLSPAQVFSFARSLDV